MRSIVAPWAASATQTGATAPSRMIATPGTNSGAASNSSATRISASPATTTAAARLTADGSSSGGASSRHGHGAHNALTDETASLTTSAAARLADSGASTSRWESTVWGQRLDVVGERVVAALHHRVGLGRAQQQQAGARARAEVDAGVLAGAPQDAHDVVAQRLRGANALGRVLGGQHLGRGRHRRKRQHAVAGLVVGEHPGLGAARGVAERDPDHEPVDLGLGQRVRALVFDRVLGGEHDERTSQLVGMHVDGHAPLLHALEQAGLGLGRGAVDLVDQHDVREHGTGAKLEPRLALVVDIRPDDVGREQVRRALHARELAVDRPRQRPRERGLADAGIVLDQHVALGQQGHHQMRQRLGANLHRVRDVAREPPRQRGVCLTLVLGYGCLLGLHPSHPRSYVVAPLRQGPPERPVPSCPAARAARPHRPSRS